MDIVAVAVRLDERGSANLDIPPNHQVRGGRYPSGSVTELYGVGGGVAHKADGRQT